MLETKCFRDMNQNYLVIKGPDIKALSPYQQKMIAENDIPGLLRVSQRHIDSDTYFYYEINSLQTLTAMFERRKMDKPMAVRLISGLINVLKEARNYLLSNEGLLLKPEFIFLNWEKEAVYFVFFPYENEAAPDQIKQLFEYLVRIIDHHDERLTDKMYELCQLAERKILSVDDLERHLAELCLAQMEETPAEKTFGEPEIKTDVIVEKEEKAAFLASKKTNEGTAGTIFTALYQRIFKRNANKKGTAHEEANGFLAETDCLQPVASDPVPEYCGDTIFISEDVQEHKLYGFGRGNKNIIDLAQFPFTIGKLADNSDFCLKEASISRIHAKFTKYENEVFMTDLNSTNGTYRNGLRLEPNETVPVEAGDEIRFGKLKFYYR